MEAHALVEPTGYEVLDAAGAVVPGRAGPVLPGRHDGEVPRNQSETLRRDSRYRRPLIAADLLAALATCWFLAAVGPGTRFSPAALLLAMLAPVAAKLGGLYDRDAARLHKSTLEEVPQLLALTTALVLIAWVGSRQVLGRLLTPEDVVAGWFFLAAALVTGRSIARHLATTFTSPERCLFVGQTEGAARFAEKLAHDRGANATIVAQVQLQDLDAADVADTRGLVNRLGVQRVVIASELVEGSNALDLMRTFEAVGVRVSVMPALLSGLGPSVQFDSVDGTALLGVRSFELTRSSILLKRAFDFVGAAAILLVLSPLFALIALAITRDSPGGVFFRQRRIGRGGRQFCVLKFRTMVADAEARKAELVDHNEAADGFFKIREDPRITRVGRILRKTSVDELPQLINVLRGEMSLVGPRPLIPEEDARVVGWHRRRLELTPGITGPWQVLGSSRVPLREMAALDYLYVANWSLWNDVKLMLRTVPHVVSQRGQ